MRLAAAGAAIRALDPRFLTTVARGSSDHAAAFLKYAIELTAGVPVASLGPSIASIYGARLKLAQSASIAISQSGKSPDIVAMAKSARDGGALTIAITNTAGSPLAAASDHAIDIRAGTEKSVAATKTFVTSAVAGLAILGEWTGDKALLAALGELPAHFAKAIVCDWMEIAGALAATQFAVHPRPRAIGGHRQRGGAEVQGDLRHARRGLHRGRSDARAAGAGRGRAFRCWRWPPATGPSRRWPRRRMRWPTRVRQSSSPPGAPRKGTLLPFAATGHPLTDPLALIVSFYAFVEAFARHRGLNPDEPHNLRKVTETL